jgi:hypothetical protein
MLDLHIFVDGGSSSQMRTELRVVILFSLFFLVWTRSIHEHFAFFSSDRYGCSEQQSKVRSIRRQLERFKSSHTNVYTNTFIVDFNSLQSIKQFKDGPSVCGSYELSLYYICLYGNFEIMLTTNRQWVLHALTPNNNAFPASTSLFQP